MYIGYSTEEYC